MMITDSMIRFYADFFSKGTVDRNGLIDFIILRENCSFDIAEQIEYDVLCFLGEEI